MKYLDFDSEKHEKGYEKLPLSRNSIKSNVGKNICFVHKRSIDRYRGYFRVEYGTISGIRYNKIFLNNWEDEIDLRDVVEAGVKNA